MSYPSTSRQYDRKLLFTRFHGKIDRKIVHFPLFGFSFVVFVVVRFWWRLDFVTVLVCGANRQWSVIEISGGLSV